VTNILSHEKNVQLASFRLFYWTKVAKFAKVTKILCDE